MCKFFYYLSNSCKFLLTIILLVGHTQLLKAGSSESDETPTRNSLKRSKAIPKGTTKKQRVSEPQIETETTTSLLPPQPSGIDADAAYQLGNAWRSLSNPHKDAEGLSYSERCSKTIEHFTEAARRGHIRAKLELATMYLNKTGAENLLQEERESRAFELFQEAANAGDLYGIYNLAKMYHSGTGCIQNTQTAKDLYKQAKNEGVRIPTNLNAWIENQAQ